MYRFNAEKIKNECVAWIRGFFEKNGKGYLRYDTYAAERAYALSEIESLLETAGFRLLSVTDGYSDKPIKTDSLRLVITAMAIKE